MFKAELRLHRRPHVDFSQNTEPLRRQRGPGPCLCGSQIGIGDQSGDGVGHGVS
jgi:hypothetical protein